MQNTYQKTNASPPERSPLKRITICADDFGMDNSVDHGIADLAQRGRLSAASCMTQGPSLRANAPLLAGLPVDLGLHLNFTESFGKSEFHLPLPQLIVASYLRLLPKAQLATQINRQLDAFESCFKRPPDYIDGHQHVHQLPLIRDSLLASIGQRYPQHRLWLRSTLPAADVTRPYRLKTNIIAWLGARKMGALAAKAGWPMSKHLLGVYDFSPGRAAYQALLLRWLNEAQEDDVLMCHPAKAVAASVAFGQQRVWEHSVLADPEFPNWLAAAELSLTQLSKRSS